MLVLTRKPGEKVQIGTEITLTIIEVTADRVRIGIGAPDQVTILREELLESIELHPPAEADSLIETVQ